MKGAVVKDAVAKGTFVTCAVAVLAGLAGCGHSPDEGSTVGGISAPSGQPAAGATDGSTAAPADAAADPGAGQGTGQATGQGAAAGGGTSAGAGAAPADKEAALRTAIESYTNALLAANASGMSGYFDKSCTPSDIATTVYAARDVKAVAKGATIKVTGVTVHGDRGEMTSYELSPGAPDALRRMLKAAQEESDADPWRYTDGEWYFTAVCGTTPDPGMAPAPSAKPTASPKPMT